MNNCKETDISANIRFSYIPSISNDGRILIIARKFDKESKTIEYGVAIKGPKDVHKKSFGKMIAAGRLLKDKTCRKISATSESIINQIIKDLHTNPMHRMHYINLFVKEYYDHFKISGNEFDIDSKLEEKFT